MPNRLIKRIETIEKSINQSKKHHYDGVVESFDASSNDNPLWDVDGELIGGSREKIIKAIRRKYPKDNPESHISKPDPDRMPDHGLIIIPFERPENIPKGWNEEDYVLYGALKANKSDKFYMRSE